jgi:hypothetical protein
MINYQWGLMHMYQFVLSSQKVAEEKGRLPEQTSGLKKCLDQFLGWYASKQGQMPTTEA